MGTSCCTAGETQQVEIDTTHYTKQKNMVTMTPVSPEERVRNVASDMSYKQIMLVIKFQARVRGMLTRNRLKASPKYRDLFNRHQTVKEGTPMYKNNQVIAIKQKQGNFKYGNAPQESGQGVEQRDFKILKDLSKYEGQWLVGTKVRHGMGLLTWPDGSIYEGWWNKDQANGQGRLIHFDGSMYVGAWLNDKCHGQGIYYHLNGTKYDGQWKENSQHGHGVETWPDGTVYAGKYKNGDKHGKGKFTWPDSSQFEGDFEDNKIQGQGVYTWSDGRVFLGSWINNKMDGKGVFTWQDGRKYEGQYKDDQKHGYGIFIWPNGRKYEGQWLNGKQHGEGIYTSTSGQIRKGIWEQGKRIKWLDEEDSQIQKVQDE